MPLFTDIRPFPPREIPPAMQRIAANHSFPILASFAFPNTPLEQIRTTVQNIKTTSDFQIQFMKPLLEQVIAKTITSFTFSGLHHLSPNKAYLFISNHRDIVLDSCLFQYILFNNGFQTTQITFGANLMQGEFITDIGKANKMFRVERPSNNPREFYIQSKHLSDYIRHVITQQHESIWIAQRNGRTKDGADQTEQGIIKMFELSRTDNKLNSLAELNIVPLSISYEWEPCDILKTLELYMKAKMGTYIKKLGEDLNSILTGITQPKGAVHLEICPPIAPEELAQFDSLTLSDFNRSVAALIDSRINSAYRLYPNNYIAHDLRYGNSNFANRYSSAQKQDFINHLDKLKAYEQDCDLEQLVELLTSIYSNPITRKTHEARN